MIRWGLTFTAFIGIVCLLGGCRSSRLIQPTAETLETLTYLSSKLQVTIPLDGELHTLNGSLKMKTGERIQLSFLMPVLRNEVARIDLTPSTILILDRKNKQYVSTTWQDINKNSTDEISYDKIEKMLLKASLPGGENSISGHRLGFTSFADAQLLFYDFSIHEITLIPTTVSDRYTALTLDEL